MPSNALSRRANMLEGVHSPTRRKVAQMSPQNKLGEPQCFFIGDEAGVVDEPQEWVSIVEKDPTLGFEQVENLDFNQLRKSLAQLETSVRLLGRAADLAHPQQKPMKLRPSVYECMRRKGPNVAEIVLKDAHYIKQVPEDVPEKVDITVKHESESGQMKLSLEGRRNEPVTIGMVKEAMVAQLGGGNTAEFGFILKNNCSTGIRLDYEILRPKQRQYELIVRGIQLPKSPKELEINVPTTQSQQWCSAERHLLSPLSVSKMPLSILDDADMSPAVSVSTEMSWRQVSFGDMDVTNHASEHNHIWEDGDENEWSML